MEEKMAVAVRVLAAVQYHYHPVPSDIATLQSWVDPLDQAADDDELACIVIMAELQRRKDSRSLREL